MRFWSRTRGAKRFDNGMLTLALGVACGVAVGRARGGSMSRLANLRFRSSLLLGLAIVAQAALSVVPPRERIVPIAGAYGLAGVWLLRNTRWQRGGVRAGFGLLAIGWLLNALPIVLNRGMPVSLHALARVRAAPGTRVSEAPLLKHVAASSHTLLAPLGDVIPVPAYASVISVGDILMVAAVAVILAAAMGRSAPALAATVQPRGARAAQQ